MQNSRPNKSRKRVAKITIKRRFLELFILIPVGIGFAVLFWFINLSLALQLILTILCWGAAIVIVELIIWLVSRHIAKKNELKPKRRDPFAD
jgi:ABC-type bacteriocin/lantibiotic exporter with double-glycine peptidase domain